jgi:hypothetical protein
MKDCPTCKNDTHSTVIKAGGKPIDIIKRRDVAQNARTVLFCWDEEQDATGQWQKHPLHMKSVKVYNSRLNECFDENRCSECDAVYTKTNGHIASAEEIEEFKRGKIPPASPIEKWMGRNNP